MDESRKRLGQTAMPGEPDYPRPTISRLAVARSTGAYDVAVSIELGVATAAAAYVELPLAFGSLVAAACTALLEWRRRRGD